MTEYKNLDQITSKFGEINWRDFRKGLLIAVIVPVVGTLYAVISHWFNNENAAFEIDWKELARSAFYSFTAYISKNLFEPTKTVIIVKPPVKQGEPDKNVDVEVTKSDTDNRFQQ